MFPCSPGAQQGQALMEAKPEFEPVVRDRLAKLHELWEQLESTTQEKARLLFDANRSELYDQSLADMKKWLGGLQQQLQSGDEDAVKDLTNANILLKKHQVRRSRRGHAVSLKLIYYLTYQVGDAEVFCCHPGIKRSC